MNKSIFTIFLCFIPIFLFSQEKSSKWSAELDVNVGAELEMLSFGLEYGTKINYSIIDRFGVFTSIGSFQSMYRKSKHGVKNNYSTFLWSIDVFGDIIKNQKGHRLRLSAGATYFKGALTYEAVLINEEPVTINWQYYNKIGLNVILSYQFPIAQKWYMNVNAKMYDIPSGSWATFTDIWSFGVSVGYKF
jgi:hypothetical protein